MGCITSSQKDVDAEPSGEVKALSMDMKTRFANVDADVLGDYKDEAVARLAFIYGRSANIYIITTPPFHPAHHHEHGESHAEKEKKEGEEGAEQPRPEKEHAEDAEAAAAENKKDKPVKEVRWAIFNDSKSEAKLESTFFHAEHLRSAGSEESVKLVRMDNGAVRASISIPAGATVPFVEGPINGYMYKCVVHDPKTNTFELAASAV